MTWGEFVGGWMEEVGEKFEVWSSGLIPGDAHMIDCDRCTDSADLLIRPLCCNKIVQRKNHAANIPQPPCLYPHGGPETSIQSSHDPCCAEIRPAI